MEAFKTDPTMPELTEELREETWEKLSKISAQGVTVYEHPWVYKWGAFLYEANKEVFTKAYLVGFAITFKMCFQMMTGNPFGAFISWSLIMACFKLSSAEFNPITITSAKLELVRLVHSGKKDPFASIIIFTNMAGDEMIFSSKEF